jgi:hypothetical protein
MFKSRRIRYVGHNEHMRELRIAHEIVVGNSEGRRSLGRPRCIWEDDIRMGLNGSRVGRCGLDA